MLDTKKLYALEEMVEKAKPQNKIDWDIMDAVALNFINNIPLAHSQPYLGAEYVKYYFRIKKETISKNPKKNNAYDKFWEGC